MAILLYFSFCFTFFGILHYLFCMMTSDIFCLLITLLYDFCILVLLLSLRLALLVVCFFLQELT